MRRAALLLALTLAAAGASLAQAADCPIPPAFDPGAGKLYACAPAEGERHLIEYARRSYREPGLREDAWLNVRGVFADRLWVNVGAQETNDTAAPAWGEIARLLDEMRAIKAGDQAALQRFLASGALAEAPHLLATMRDTATHPPGAAVRAVLYHVHLKPSRDFSGHPVEPINHALSIPSHLDLIDAPRLAKLSPGGEAKIAVAAGVWTYDWDQAEATRFVAREYDGPDGVPFVLKFTHAYTLFAITAYHRFGFNDPTALTPERVAEYVALLRSRGARVAFALAPDWDAARPALAAALPKPRP